MHRPQIVDEALALIDSWSRDEHWCQDGCGVRDIEKGRPMGTAELIVERRDEVRGRRRVRAHGCRRCRDGQRRVRTRPPGPMEVLLMGVMSCTAMDVLSILRKKRQEPQDFKIIRHVRTVARTSEEIHAHSPGVCGVRRRRAKGARAGRRTVRDDLLRRDCDGAGRGRGHPQLPGGSVQHRRCRIGRGRDGVTGFAASAYRPHRVSCP